MARFVAFLLLVTMSLTENLQITPKAKSDVIKAIQRHFQAKCIVFVTAGETLREQLSTLETQKEINSVRDTVHTSALTCESLWAAEEKLLGRCSQRLFVIHAGNTDMQKLLEKLSPAIEQFQHTLWLLLTTSTAPVAAMFVGVYIPFDVQLFVAQSLTEGAVVLTEAFRVARNQTLQVQEFGRWTLRTGLVAQDRCLQIRRPNLTGLTLRLAEYHNPPMSTRRDKTRSDESSFQTEIWNILEGSLNFSTSFVVEEGTWGNLLPDGSWDGMIAKLLEGEVDVASVTPMFSERAEVATFAFPLYDSDYNVYLRKRSDKTVDWGEWLEPFSPLLWTAFVLLSLATGVLMVVLSDLVRRHGRDEKPMSVYDQVFLVYGAIICQQGQEGTPFSWPCRIIYFISYFTGIVVISSYSATVVSRLTVGSDRLPFTDLEGLLAHGGFGLGALVSSFSFTLFQVRRAFLASEVYRRTNALYCMLTWMMNADHGLLKQLYEQVMNKDPRNFIEDSLEGFVRACTSRFGFISTPEKLVVLQNTLRKRDCALVALPNKFLHFTASFMLPKNSPYIGWFNHEILRLLNDGVLRKTFSKYMEAPREGPQGVPFTEIQIEDVTPMLGIVVGGIASGVVLLGLELLAIYLLKKYNLAVPERAHVPAPSRAGDWRRYNRATYGSAARTRNKELYPHYQGMQRRFRNNRSTLNT